MTGQPALAVIAGRAGRRLSRWRICPVELRCLSGVWRSGEAEQLLFVSEAVMSLTEFVLPVAITNLLGQVRDQKQRSEICICVAY